MINDRSQSIVSSGFDLAGLQSRPINRDLQPIIRDLPIKESHWFTSLAIKSNLKTKLWTQTKQGGFGVLGLEAAESVGRYLALQLWVDESSALEDWVGRPGLDEVLAKKFVLNWLRYAVEVAGSLSWLW